MNSESLVLRQLAIRERRQYLDLVYSKDGAAPKRAGLVALSRAVYLLAARRIVRPENRPADAPELVKVSWEIEWYGHYLEALQELTPLLQTAIRDRRIIPRGLRTSAPVGLDQISRWLDLDPRAMIAASTKAFFAGIVLPTEPYAIWAGWPDALILSSGVFVTLNDLTAWVKTEGIATSEEMTALLSTTECSPSGTPEKAAPPVALSDWRNSARAIADECFDKDTANKCRDSLAGYSRRVMGEMQTREIHGPRGLIDNPNTIQREALQGARWWKGKTP